MPSSSSLEALDQRRPARAGPTVMLQWSKRAVCASTRVDAGRQRAFAGEEQVVAVDHARGVDLAGQQRAGRVPFAADVVAVQPDADVEPPHREVRAGRARACAGASAAAASPGASRPRPTPTVLPAVGRRLDRRCRRARRRPTSGRGRVSRIARARDLDRPARSPGGARAPTPAASSRPRRCGPPSSSSTCRS